MSATKMLQTALAEVGYLEKRSNVKLYDKTANAGSANYTKYGAWFDSGKYQAQPWCDMFVSWCAAQCGEAEAVGHFAYCPSHVNFFKAKGQWFGRGAKTPQPGDIIFFANDGKTACHVGIVEKVSGGYVHTIEGNTNGGTTLIANGGGVHQKKYVLTSSYILGYGRPAYAADYIPGWNKNAADWWYVHEDGSYPKSAWELVDGKWYYFDKEGYMMVDQWVMDNGKLYFVGADGAMVTNKAVRIGADGALVPDGDWYHTLGEVPQVYRETLDRLIAEDKLKGRSGIGEELVLDMSEEAVRLLVIMGR